MRGNVYKWKNKEVEITYNGITYRGKLIEVTDEYTLIRRTQGYASIPTASITSMKPVDEKPGKKPF